MFNKIKSPETLFNKTISDENMLLIVNKNILYLTHTVDKCLSLLKKMQIDDDLQKQVDDYMETSPQTDSTTKEDAEPD